MATPDILQANPDLSDRKRQARQAEKLREIPPRYVMILRPIDRKILPPLRLKVQRPTVRRAREHLRIARRGKRVGGRGACQALTRGRINALVDRAFRFVIALLL